MRPIISLITVLVLSGLGLVWIVSTWGPQGEPLAVSARQNADLLELTGTTARLSGNNDFETSVAYAQAIYAAAQDEDRPGAVVLVRDDDEAAAIASTRLQHMPVNAPMLFLTDGGTTIPQETLDELERLGPEGVMMDNNTQIYIVGDIGPDIENQLDEALDYETRRIYADNAVDLTEQLDEFLAVLDSNHADVVLLGALEALQFSYPAANWNAHMGEAFAYVSESGVPDATRRMLERRAPSYPFMYVFAPEDVIGPEVMAELSQYGHVQRIPGATPQEMAVFWAGYKDPGRKLGWWFGERARAPGWGYAEPGHNSILANPGNWREVLPSGVLSHMGKHAFLLLTAEDGSIPQAVRDYMGGPLKPTRTYPSQQVYNFAWIAGPDSSVSDAVMRDYAGILEISGLREPRLALAPEASGLIVEEEGTAEAAEGSESQEPSESE